MAYRRSGGYNRSPKRTSSRGRSTRSYSGGGYRRSTSRVQRRTSQRRAPSREVRIVIQQAAPPAAPAYDPATGQFVGPAPKPRNARF
jgi:hypothetical protein